MRICIPSMGMRTSENVCQHFGRAPYFLIFDEQSGECEVLENSSEHMGGTGKPPELIASKGADVMVCFGLGPKAIQMLSSYGIRTYVGASGTVEDALRQWNDGLLHRADMDNACKEHRDGHDH